MRLTYQKNKIVHRPVPGTPKAESARSCRQVKLPWGWFEYPTGGPKASRQLLYATVMALALTWVLGARVVAEM